MPGKIELTGLKGLNFNSQEGKAWIAKQRAAGIITDEWNDYDIQALYNNQQFIDKFGLEAFNAMINDPEGRNTYYNNSIIDETFYNTYNPYIEGDDGELLIDPSKGMGNDFLKYNAMDYESKKKLLESGWLTPTEMQKKLAADESKRMEDALAAQRASMGTGAASMAVLGEYLTEPIKQNIDKKSNDALLAKIYSEDLQRKGKSKEAVTTINAVLNSDELSGMGEEDVDKLFKESITPTDTNIGNRTMSAYYNEGGETVEDELKQFSTEDKKAYLAKKIAYEGLYGSEIAAEILEDDTKRYVANKQSGWTYAGLLGKDILISTASYTADKLNSVRMLGLALQDRDGGVTVYKTQGEDGEIVPTNTVQQAYNGKYYSNGVEVFPVKMNRTTLDWMGKDSEGNTRDALWNQQYWSDAEQYGTWDRDLQDKYKKLGVSPYKVAYEPGDDSDIKYEALKMTSFALADVGSMIIPYGLGAIGEAMAGVSNLAKVTSIVNGIGTGLKYTSKAMQVVSPSLGAFGIGNAYGRGLNGEAVQQNLTSLNEAINNEALSDFQKDYAKPEFKDAFDEIVESEAAKMKKQLLESTNGNSPRYVDNEALDNYVRQAAREKVRNQYISRRIKEKKADPKYEQQVAEAYNSAGDAALAASFTTGAKYFFVNNFGYRNFLFKTQPQRVQQAMSRAYRGVREVLTDSGKRLFKAETYKGLGGKAMHLGVAALKQGWGGAWTNATDELQSEGARAINEDRYSSYLRGQYDSEASANTYGALEGVVSYMNGFARGLANESTWKAGLVGALGSYTSFAPNAAAFMSGNFRAQWKSAKSIGEKANLLISNGLLNEYYSGKQAERDVIRHVEAINKIMDDYEDFQIIQDGLAIDMALRDAQSMADQGTLNYLKAMNAIEQLYRFDAKEADNNKKWWQFWKKGSEMSEKEASRIAANIELASKSSVMQEALQTLDKIKSLGEDGKMLTRAETDALVGEYFAKNPNIARTEDTEREAIRHMLENAETLTKGFEHWQEAEKLISDEEKRRGETMPPIIRYELKKKFGLDKHWTDRLSTLEESISGQHEVTDTPTIESFGEKEARDTHIKLIDKDIEYYTREVESQREEVEKKEQEFKDAKETLKDEKAVNTEEKLKAVLQEAQRRQVELEKAKLKLGYLEGRVDKLTSTRDFLSSAPAEENRVLSSDEILRLSPEDRARMLDLDNLSNYSKEQQEVIKKTREELSMKNPGALYDIEESAVLDARVRSNRESYQSIFNNPYTAASQFAADRDALAWTTRHVPLQRASEEFDKLFTKLETTPDVDEDVLRESVYKNLRVLNPYLIKYYRDSGLPSASKYAAEIDRALDWSNVLMDVKNIVDNNDQWSDVEKQAIQQSLDGILEQSSTREELMQSLEDVVHSNQVSEADKKNFETLIQSLERVGYQRTATAEMTPEEIQTAMDEAERRDAEEERIKLEAEKRAVDEATSVVSDKDMDTTADEDAELQSHGLGREDLRSPENELSDKQIDEALDNDAYVALEEEESPELEDQALNSNETVVPIPTDDGTDQGNKIPEQMGDTVTHFQGNIMFRYEVDALKDDGVQKKRKWIPMGRNNQNDLFKWFDDAGIHYQEIIDQELNDIKQLNQPVFPLYTDYRANATHDNCMTDRALLAVEYTPEVQSIHNEQLGGVVTSNGVKYLIVGMMGFDKGKGMSEQGVQFRQILMSGEKARTKFINENPSERFYVDRTRHTFIKDITAGRRVKQMADDSGIEIRSVSELLSDSKRNPKGLKIQDLKWTIAYDRRWLPVNISDMNTVYYPTDGVHLSGSTFLLIECANGNYVPAHIRPTRLSEIKEGKLKSKIDELLMDLTSTKRKDRVAAEKKLRMLINIQKGKDWLLLGTDDKPTVTIEKDGVKKITFDLASPTFNRVEFMEAIYTILDPRINITKSALSDATGLSQMELDEAGALRTDIASLHASNASYTVYSMDSNGEPIITEPVGNKTPNTEITSDLAKAQKKDMSEDYGGITYRRDELGNWKDENKNPVTDPMLIEQLKYRNIIRTRNLSPSEVTTNDEVFIISSSTDSPDVVIRKRKTGQIVPMTKEGALRTIKRVNEKEAERIRQENRERELQEDDAKVNRDLEGVTESALDKALDNDAEADLGLETPTEEELMGNFDSTQPLIPPQQESAETAVSKINANTASIRLSEDGKTYIDDDGRTYARVTSVIAADEYADERFDENNPWGLPSTTIGTGIDEFVRDYFDNKLGNLDNLAERYPNATNESLQSFVKQLDGLKEEFKRRGLTIVPRDVTVSGTIFITDKNGEKKALDVAGTLDLLAYDREGNFYIFDMKTNRSAPTGEYGRKKGAKWSKQLTLYKQLLQEKYGIVVKGMEIIPIQVSYPAPKGFRNSTTEYSVKGNQLYANGAEYKGTSPMLHPNIPITETQLQVDFNKLTPLEQSMVRPLEESPTTPSREPKDSKTVDIRPKTPLPSGYTRADLNGSNTSKFRPTMSEFKKGDKVSVGAGKWTYNGTTLTGKVTLVNEKGEKLTMTKDEFLDTQALSRQTQLRQDLRTREYQAALEVTRNNSLEDLVKNSINSDDVIYGQHSGGAEGYSMTVVDEDYSGVKWQGDSGAERNIGRTLKLGETRWITSTNGAVTFAIGNGVRGGYESVTFRRQPPQAIVDLVEQLGYEVVNKISDIYKAMKDYYSNPQPKPIVQTEPHKTGEDINSTGEKSLSQLQAEKSLDTALAIMKSKEYGKRVRDLLKAKFPDMPKKPSDIERFLQEHKISVTNIDDVESWIDMIQNCK